jgi:hypothetical protein
MAVMMTMSLFPVLGYAANPFLDASNDQPVSAKFRGTEWSDDIGEEEVSLTALVVTTRIAKMPWGDLQSRIHGFKIAYRKATRNSAGLLHRD